MKFLIAYVSGLIAFLAIDFVWLKYIALKFYQSNIGHLMTDKPNLLVAGLFYLVYVVGVVILAVYPALEKQSFLIAIGHGMLLGLIAYGTYDITNLATLRDWPVQVAVVDIIWGMVLTATVSGVSYLAARSFH